MGYRWKNFALSVEFGLSQHGKIWCDPEEENYSHLILMMKDENYEDTSRDISRDAEMSQYASKKQETNSDQNVPISKNSKYSVEQQFKKNV